MISIDPGRQHVGVAMFDEGKLVDAFCVHAKKADSQLFATAQTVISKIAYRWPGACTPFAQEVALEMMQTRESNVAAHASIIELEFLSGLLAAKFNYFTRVPANEWTGGRPKHINHSRIRRRLEEKERDVLVDALEEETRSSNHKEILDAIGIGLYHLKRL